MKEPSTASRGMRGYVLLRASRLRKAYGRVDAEGLVEDALADPRFHELWNLWKKGGYKKGDAPSFLVVEDRWVQTRENIRWHLRQRHKGSGAAKTPCGHFRARAMIDGKQRCLGTYKTKEEAVKRVEQERKIHEGIKAKAK